jgi:hypothetical protein
MRKHYNKSRGDSAHRWYHEALVGIRARDAETREASHARPLAFPTLFTETNTDWPRLDAPREHAEQIVDDVPEPTVLAYFELHRPFTPKGSLRLLANAGQREAAITRIRELWRQP